MKDILEDLITFGREFEVGVKEINWSVVVIVVEKFVHRGFASYGALKKL
jgi:GR25 family glycosyltransferase involved in LPS biosynthesis